MMIQEVSNGDLGTRLGKDPPSKGEQMKKGALLCKEGSRSRAWAGAQYAYRKAL